MVSTGLLALSIGVLLAGAATPVAAQDGPPVTVSAGVDVPSLYYFRGFRQETEPKLTMQPWVDVGVPLMTEGEGALKSTTLNVGLWNSWHTGSSGSGDGGPGFFYETDFYATLTLGLENMTIATTYTAYTYPSPDFDAIHEILGKVSFPHMLAPYGLIAYEFLDCEACHKSTYAEVGIAPAFPLGDAETVPTLTIPVKIGLGVDGYYAEGASFGFASVGGTVTYPVSPMATVKFGGEVLMLGDGAEELNFDESFETSSTGFVVFGGVALTF
jgi:hypothetical protein